MSEEVNVSKPEGKGLAVSGFIIALVGLVLNLPVMATALLSGSKGLAYFWVFVCVLGLVLAIMGMKKLGATGGKKGLAIAGLVIGIVAVLWSLTSAMAIGEASDLVNQAYDQIDLQDLQDIADELEDIQ